MKCTKYDVHETNLRFIPNFECLPHLLSTISRRRRKKQAKMASPTATETWWETQSSQWSCSSILEHYHLLNVKSQRINGLLEPLTAAQSSGKCVNWYDKHRFLRAVSHWRFCCWQVADGNVRILTCSYRSRPRNCKISMAIERKTTEWHGLGKWCYRSRWAFSQFFWQSCPWRFDISRKDRYGDIGLNGDISHIN